MKTAPTTWSWRSRLSKATTWPTASGWRAPDGAEALDLLFGAAGRPPAEPKVIMLDLNLPKVDGREVLKRIKSDPRTQHIPEVVMMTSSSEASDVVRSYQLGVNSYVVKPVDFEKFTESVRQLGLYWPLLNHRPAN